MSIRSDWLEDGQSHGRRFIPTSQGLLTTADNRSSLPASSSGVSETQPRAAPLSHGLRLLQLHPPPPLLLRPPPAPAPPAPPVQLPVREAWGPNLTSSYGNVLPEPSSVRRAEDGGRAASVAPPSHLQTGRFNAQMSRGAQEALHLPPAPHRSISAVALPLLRFHPETQRPVTLPHIPQSTTAKPSSLGVTATGHYPRIQLLHREPDPPAAVSLHLHQQLITRDSLLCLDCNGSTLLFTLSSNHIYSRLMIHFGFLYNN